MFDECSAFFVSLFFLKKKVDGAADPRPMN